MSKKNILSPKSPNPHIGVIGYRCIQGCIRIYRGMHGFGPKNPKQRVSRF